jgi:RNA polymerase sigma factor (sigma-70 family)
MACAHEYSVEGVYESFHTGLRRFVLTKVSDPAAADDILQDVYLRIHTHIDSLRDCGRLQSWVYQIARNAIIDYYRGRRPMVSSNSARARERRRGPVRVRHRMRADGSAGCHGQCSARQVPAGADLDVV